MANVSLVVTSDKSLLLAARNTQVYGVELCAAAATSTIEVFDGTIGTIATKAIGAAGTLYLVGDLITLVQAGGGVKATFTVASVDDISTGVVTALTLVSGGTGYTAGTTYATTTNSVAGSGLTVTASTVTDAGTSILKLSAVANTSQRAQFECGILTTAGVSLRITGTSAKAYLFYD